MSEQAGSDGILRIKRLEITDDNDCTRLVVGMSGEGHPIISILDAEQRQSITLVHFPSIQKRPHDSRPHIYLFDEQGNKKITLSLAPDGEPIISMMSADLTASVGAVISGDNLPELLMRHESRPVSVSLRHLLALVDMTNAIEATLESGPEPPSQP